MVSRRTLLSVVRLYVFAFAFVIAITFIGFWVHSRASGFTEYIDSYPVLGSYMKTERIRAETQKAIEDQWVKEYRETPHRNYGEWTSDVFYQQNFVLSIEWKRLVWRRGGEIADQQYRVILTYLGGTAIGELPFATNVQVEDIRRTVDYTIISSVNAQRVRDGLPILTITNSDVEIPLSHKPVFVRWLMENPLNVMFLIVSGLMLGSMWTFIRRLMNSYSGKSILIPYRPTKETPDDLGNLPQVKERIKEFEAMIVSPKVFLQFGGDFMPGILFSGKPGTGKSLSARVLANIAVKRGVAAYNINTAQLIDMAQGAAPAKIRDIFRRVREKGTALLIFDEAEAFTRERRFTQSGTEEEKSDALVALITEIDGVQKYIADQAHSRSIVVLLISNRPDLIDDALLRSGRVGIHINFSVPDSTEARKEILWIHGKGKRFPPQKKEEWLWYLAQKSEGFTGADLAALLGDIATKAALRYARVNAKVPLDAYITREDLEEGLKERLEMLVRRKDILDKNSLKSGETN